MFVEDKLKEIEKLNNIELSDKQREAIYSVSDNNVSSTTPNDSNILLDENSDINTSNDTSTSNNTNTNNYISRDKAIEIALNHAKLEKSSVRDLDADLERKYNTVVYEVDFEYQNYDYEYYIDATKGTIVHSFKEIDY